MIAHRLAFASLTLSLFAGCAATAPPREPSAPAREPASIDEANEQIRLAEQTLSGMSGASAAGNGSPAAAGVMPTKPALAQGVDADAKAEAAPKKNATRAQGDERAESVTKEEPSPCDRACRALQSMTTAVNAICRMTGSDDARCAQAKSTLEKNRESASVRTCGCPRL